MNDIERDAARYRALKAEHEREDAILVIYETADDGSTCPIDYDSVDAWVDQLIAGELRPA